jgi:hypothetical protein
MSTQEEELRRMAQKTPQERFKQVLVEEFHYAPKIAEAILAEAEDCLWGKSAGMSAGQIRVVLAKRGGAGKAETTKGEVIWTVDSGAEDREVQQRYGREALRQVRIQRLLDEAVEQGALATQEDLAQALHTSVRTIKRDFVELQAQDVYLPSRGQIEGIGRGQTHKGQIIRRWLDGETYDRLATHTHHSPTSIQRYVRSFLQVVGLHRQDFTAPEIGLALQMGLPLVEAYLSIYHRQDTPAHRARLDEEMERLQRGFQAQKGAI